jgi:hypothetical protein
MLDFSAANLHRFSSSWVGNKARYEGVSCPDHTLTSLNDVTEELMLTSLLKPFTKTQEYFYFTGTEDVGDNLVYQQIQKVFQNPDTLAESSKAISSLLYEASENPKIRGGEFFLAYLEDVMLEGYPVSAIGLWKIQSKNPFFRTERTADSLLVSTMEGIPTETAQVAALIFNVEELEGYRVCAIDKVTKKGERSFWKDDFLRVRELEDNYFQTKHTVALVTEFITQKAAFKFGLNRLQVIELLNKAGNYFKDFEEFQLEDFSEKVYAGFPEGMFEAQAEFHSGYAAAYGLPLVEMFEINIAAVKKFFKLFSNKITMDDNFILQVKGRPDLIEGGVDEERGLRFYKVYFTEQD